MKTRDPRHWLMKSEADCYSIDDLKNDGSVAWVGVRNFQARNFMNDMAVGDLVVFYHSSSKPTGAVGIARVCAPAHPDATALDPKDEHFDPRASAAKPIWTCVDIEFVEKLKTIVPIDTMRFQPKLKGMEILRRGSRLSVTPLSKAEFDEIARLGSLE